MNRWISLVALFVTTPLLPAQDRLTPELLWDLRRVSDPQPSPDGRSLLYGVRTYELSANKGEAQLFLQDIGSGKKRQLTTVGSNFAGRWSPDGKTIAFLSTRGGAPQIYTVAVDGGEARQVTTRPGGVANMSWSPAGDRVAFTAHVALDPVAHDMHPDLPHADVKVYDELLVRHWDEWKDGSYSHLFVAPVAGGEPVDLMAGERFDTPVKPFGGAEQIAWSPDGAELCYTAKKVEGSEWVSSTNNDLYVVSVNGGAAVNITKGMPGYDQEPVYSPDGSYIAFLSMARAGFEADRSRIMLYHRATGEISELTAGFDQSAHGLAFGPSSDVLYFDSDVAGTTQLYSVALSGGSPELLTGGRYQYRGATPGPSGEWLVCVRQQTERPYEVVRIWLGDRAGEAPEQLTDENGAAYAELELPTVEERWFEATDGEKIHSWVVYPPDFDPTKKWPMLLYCQGGPQSQVGQWFSYRWNFHLMAAQGYVVLAVNRRGLPGFGQRWNDEISQDWSGQAMRDLLSATDQMFEEPFIDRDRTAAVGASFGGYTIYWLMGHDQEDRFKAMIAHCGVFHLESMYGSTEELFFVNWDLGGPYWASAETAARYAAHSPHSYVKEWDTPLLVVHGQKDYRVPLSQGLQAFTAARAQGVPARFVYFPEEGHWVLSPQNGVFWHRTFFEWLEEHCKGVAEAPAHAHGERRHLLERVDDTAIAQLYADGFEGLSLREKLLSYHLAKAAIAGRDIFIDQKFALSLELRDVLEELFVHRQRMSAEVRGEIERYMKLFWVHNGVHHTISTKKQLLRLGVDQFNAAVDAALAGGASLPQAARLAELYAVMTDPASHVSCTNKNPGEGADVLSASSNNFYVNVAEADLSGFNEVNPLNSRLVKVGEELVEQVYRAGDGGEIPPGLYARQLNEVIGHLEDALPYAPAPTAEALSHLIAFYRSGAVADWRAFNIAWVKDTDSVVDFINGFVEVYLDARGQKGAWEGLVSFRNPEKTKAIEALAKEAQWFEDRMPWDPEFKKKNVKGITARAISVIMETGDSGPITPIGINLPNEADIRENHGSKSVNLSNVVEGYERSSAGGSAGEFAWSAAEMARAKKWGGLSDEVHTNLHEVVGHASGLVRPEIKNPASILGMYYSTLEEARADLIGLYWINDPVMQELGLLPHPDAALAQYEGYARNALVQLRRVALGDRIEDDHMRNRQLIVLWLIENTGAIKVERRDGKTYYRVTSAAEFAAGCGRLLAEVMRIKAVGDFKAGKALVDRFGVKINRELHEEVLKRIEGLDLPSATGFVMPELRLVKDANGEVKDVVVHYPMDIADQMLRFSGRRR